MQYIFEMRSVSFFYYVPMDFLKDLSYYDIDDYLPSTQELRITDSCSSPARRLIFQTQGSICL